MPSGPVPTILPVTFPKTTARQETERAVDQAVEQARNSVYFDFGAALAGQTASGLGGLYTGLGGAVATNGGMSALGGEITLTGLQQMYNQFVTVTTVPSTIYSVGVDTAYGGLSDWSYLYQYQMNVVSGSVMNLIHYDTTPETPEQRLVREEREVKRRAERSAAEKRAEQLMFTILRPEQVRQYQDNGYFETEIDDRIYRIHKRSHSQNVELIVKGKLVAKYCAHPANCYETPVQDTMISQLLALKTDEARFLKTANKTILHG